MSRLQAISALLTAICFSAIYTSIPFRARAQVAFPEKEAIVHGLAQFTATSTDPTDVLKTALEIIIRNKGVCCGKDSALEDSVERADAKSLKDVAQKLQGRHLLSDGRPIQVTTEFLPPAEVNADHIIYELENQHAPLMQWDSRVYVVRGTTYVKSEYTNEGSVSTLFTVHRFLLEDPRYTDARRQLVFDRTKENAAQVQGFLFVGWQTQ